MSGGFGKLKVLETLESNELVTLSDFKGHLAMTGTARDAKLQVNLLAGKGFVESFLNFPIPFSKCTRFGKHEVRIAEWPVEAVRILTGLPARDPANWQASTDYELVDGVVRKTGLNATENVQVDITCGWTASTLPAEIRTAVLMTAAMLYYNATEARPINGTTYLRYLIGRYAMW